MSSQQFPIRSASLRFIKLGRQGSWEGLREHRLSLSAAPAALTTATTQTPMQHAIPMLVQVDLLVDPFVTRPVPPAICPGLHFFSQMPFDARDVLRSAASLNM